MGVILFLTATLVLSIVGVVALLTLKRYEITTGKVILGRARPTIGVFFNVCLMWVERALPALLAHVVRRGITEIKKVIHQAVAYGIHSLERALEWVLKTLHYTTQPSSSGTGEASAFLRAVAEHKKKLLRRKQK